MVSAEQPSTATSPGRMRLGKNDLSFDGRRGNARRGPRTNWSRVLTSDRVSGPGGYLPSWLPGARSAGIITKASLLNRECLQQTEGLRAVAGSLRLDVSRPDHL